MTSQAIWLLVGVLAVAAYLDIGYRRIPNWLTLPTWFLGLVLHAVSSGWTGLAEGLLGLGFMLGVGIALFVPGWLAAGDAKLLGAVGAMVGGATAPWVLAGIVLTGGVLAAGVLWRHRVMPFARLWGNRRERGSPTPTEAGGPGPIEGERGMSLPYAVPILIGTLVVMALRVPV